MVEAGLQELDNTEAQYIATRPIMDLCMVAKWRPFSRVEMWWW